MHQFQLASLELERTRRDREKQAACRRITDLDARLVEIDELIRKHQEALGLKQEHGDEAASPGHPVARNFGAPAPETRRVLRY